MRVFGSIIVNGSVFNLGRLIKFGSFGLDLNSEFLGRSKDKNNRIVIRGKEGLGVDVDYCRKVERDGFIRISFGNGDKVMIG